VGRREKSEPPRRQGTKSLTAEKDNKPLATLTPFADASQRDPCPGGDPLGRESPLSLERGGNTKCGGEWIGPGVIIPSRAEGFPLGKASLSQRDPYPGGDPSGRDGISGEALYCGRYNDSVAAFRKTRFKPVKQQDLEVGVWIFIPIHFILESRRLTSWPGHHSSSW